MTLRHSRSARRPAALAAIALALPLVLLLSVGTAQAADADKRGFTNPFARLFAPKAATEPSLPVPGYIQREADREGALDVVPAPRRSIGAVVDRALGMPVAPDDELERKYIRSQYPQSRESRSSVFDGLSRIGASLPPLNRDVDLNGAVIVSPEDSRAVYSDGRPNNAAPRIQDVAALCDDPRTLADILSRFNWVQRKTWRTDLRMVAVERPREMDYRTVGDHMVLSKRYCRATAVLNDGRHRRMVYQIVEDTGGAGGFYDRARWCVEGHDRMREHEPACRVLRHF